VIVTAFALLAAILRACATVTMLSRLTASRALAGRQPVLAAAHGRGPPQRPRRPLNTGFAYLLLTPTPPT